MSNARDQKGRLDKRLGRLPAELPPGRDLWPGIAARIVGERPRPRATWPGQVAWRWVAAAAVAVAALLLASLYRDGPPPGDLKEFPGIAAVPAFGPAYHLNAGYQAARAGLARDLDERLATLPPDTRATVLHNLETIRRAAEEINAALGDDPSNLLLQHQLLAAYQDELTVLAHLKRVTERMPIRNEI